MVDGSELGRTYAFGPKEEIEDHAQQLRWEGALEGQFMKWFGAVTLRLAGKEWSWERIIGSKLTLEWAELADAPDAKSGGRKATERSSDLQLTGS